MKIKKWVKDHKKQIVKIAAISAGGIVAVIVGKKVLKKALTCETKVEVPVQTIPIKREEVKIPYWLDICVDKEAAEVMTNRSYETVKEMAGIIDEIKNEINDIPNERDSICALINTNRDNTLGYQFI